ncbi:hypothetical protein KR222_008627 [Zaprionus bogoriensis]|nr:hypothetical protein KR222_008627 [Zaprionus bogoriensis]
MEQRSTRKLVDDVSTHSLPPKKRIKSNIYRTAYWILIFSIIAALVIGLHFALKADFGECSSYDIKCY